MAQVTPVTSLPVDSSTAGAVQLTGNTLRCSVRATALTTLALIRMDPSGKWFRISDETGAQMQFTAQPGGDAGNTDVSFSLPAAAANEYYNLIADSTFAGYAELDSLSSPPGPGTAVPSTRVLSTPAGFLIAGASSADLSADRAFTFDPAVWTPSASAIALAANISVTAAAGTGGIDYHLGTGDWKMPTGAGSWAGASGKALSFVSTAAAVTITADAPSTWKTSTGALTVDSAAALNLGTTTATSLAFAHGAIATAFTSSSANALAVGLAGTTNPAFNVDASTASSATGLNVKSAAAAAGVAVSVISSGSNENLTIAAKGSGTVTLQPAVAPAAGGNAQSSVLLSSTAALGIYFGSGAPTVSAAQGSLYLRTDGNSTSTRLYVNTNGSTTWTNVTTAA